MNRVEACESWLARWRALRAWGRPLSEVTVAWTRYDGEARIGTCWPALRKINVCIREEAPSTVAMPNALATLLHELAHAAAPARNAHGDWWQRAFLEAVNEVTGDVISGAPNQVKLVDHVVEGVMVKWWARSQSTLYRMAGGR